MTNEHEFYIDRLWKSVQLGEAYVTVHKIKTADRKQLSETSNVHVHVLAHNLYAFALKNCAIHII